MRVSSELIENLMDRSIVLARTAAGLGEVPVGAVVAGIQGEILGEAHNEMEVCRQAGAHAEMLAMRRASERLGNWRLSDTVLCVTLEPCTMCIGAIKLARVPVVIFGAFDPRLGAVGSLYDLSIDSRSGAPPRVITGVRGEECSEILKGFFKGRRRGDS